MTHRLAPNIELLFTEHGDYHDRVRAAAAAGFTSVEMWGPTGKDAPAKPKDLAALKDALQETGVRLEAQLAEPRTQFMIPPKDHSHFYRGIEEGARIAADLGCPRIVVQGGTGFGGRKRQEQHDELAGIYTRALELVEGSGVVLVLEAVNTRVDHPGTLLDRTADALDVARTVGSPQFGVLLDVYHSRVESEDLVQVLAQAGPLVRYVQVADAPGRGEPGTGSIDWAATFRALTAAGYDGPVGLEYFPTVPSEESTRHLRAVLADLGALAR
ncbi:TIM barrel protein [Kineococcus aurantiacus]|uniref:Hydroxypyruvate isomerase n=1 Tax=Kineococcus aurantiacus TaxID=37633 RepID=A0A7Y9DJW2_9ACTN|nr:hydroxypyruvate isomerase [Kineococcus aurantiacus]